MDMLESISAVVGRANLLAGEAAAPWTRDWTGKYPGTPLAVARPATTAEVSAIMAIAHDSGTPVVPAAGLTGLVGGTQAEGALVLSIDRMTRIRDIRPSGRLAIVEAGVVLADLHAAVADHDLIFPLTFGARGSARIGGVLATNAGGSNVLRYGNTRDLCLGLEVVLADGRVMNLMSELHKDNAGLNLRHLMIGSEGTLGIITAAVLKLWPKPRTYATAMVALPALSGALDLLNRLQDATGGAVEAFEFMPQSYIEMHQAHFPAARPPFDRPHPVNIFLEIGMTAPRDAEPGPDGRTAATALLEDTLGDMLESGLLSDAVIAQSEAQRAEMWSRRETAGQITFLQKPIVDTDIAVPLDAADAFLARMSAILREIDPEAKDMCVAHLGDGNIHYNAYPSRDDPALLDLIREKTEEVVQDLGGSFSAEHGIGVAKLASMRRRKDPVALQAMRAVKRALDPKGILNPGKVYPD